MELLAVRSGTPLVVADLANSLDISATTIRKYLSYLDTVFLDTVFLVALIPPWSSNLTDRVTKAPKALLTDAGLAAHLLGVDEVALQRPGHPALGGLVETFVHSELMKLGSFSELDPRIYHYRDRDGREVDFLLQTRDGRIVAGLVLHLGEVNLPFGDKIYAMPVSALWDHGRP